MIRINLIPVPKVRKQERLIIEASVGLLIIIAVVLACYFVGLSKKSLNDSLAAQNAQITQEINKLKAKVGEVEKYKQKLKTLKDQLAIINALQTGRSGPVRMMDELTDLVPRRLWLTTFRETNHKVTMQGFASDGPIVADFLDKLKSSKYFSGTELQTVQEQDQAKTELQKFTITTMVKYDF